MNGVDLVAVNFLDRGLIVRLSFYIKYIIKGCTNFMKHILKPYFIALL